jgi:hypothetical protein
MKKIAIEFLIGCFILATVIFFIRILIVNNFGALQENIPVNQFFRYLLGVVLEIGLIGLISFLNYHLFFLRLFLIEERPWRNLYWAWIAALGLGVFFLLEWRTQFEQEFADENVLLNGVLITFIVAYAYVADYFRTRRLQLQLLKEKSEAQLHVLKAQIKPHFLFNSLNTIFNSALKNENEETANLISELSGLLRFSIQDSQRDFTRIEDEISFLRRYIHLQRARLPQRENIDIQTQIIWDQHPAQIPPLLLIPFVENAFQYSITMDQPCFLHLGLQVHNQQLMLKLVNSVAANADRKKGLGTGIANSRSRLELLYPGRYTLEIQSEPTQFCVHLHLQLASL